MQQPRRRRSIHVHFLLLLTRGCRIFLSGHLLTRLTAGALFFKAGVPVLERYAGTSG
jgi:hypothetical protein